MKNKSRKLDLVSSTKSTLIMLCFLLWLILTLCFTFHIIIPIILMFFKSFLSNYNVHTEMCTNKYIPWRIFTNLLLCPCHFTAHFLQRKPLFPLLYRLVLPEWNHTLCITLCLVSSLKVMCMAVVPLCYIRSSYLLIWIPLIFIDIWLISGLHLSR